MKRDMDLVRKLLLEIEEKDVGDGQWINIKIADFSEAQITEHLFLLYKAQLVEGNDTSSLNKRSFMPRRLTWNGYDFIDSIRDVETWKKTKNGALAAGGWTVDILRDLAKGLIKKKIEDATGVKL
jgi:Hypothetical protein (DUF2513)